MNGNLSTAVISLAQSAGPALGLIQALAVLVGVFYLGEAVTKFIHVTNNRTQVSAVSPVVTLLIGSALIGFGTSVDTAVESLFGAPAANPLSYAPGVNGASGVTSAVYQIISVFGYLAIFRGFRIWKMAGDGFGGGGHHGAGGEDPVFRGATHILGGAAAVNLQLFLVSAGSTLGFNLGGFLNGG